MGRQATQGMAGGGRRQVAAEGGGRGRWEPRDDGRAHGGRRRRGQRDDGGADREKTRVARSLVTCVAREDVNPIGKNAIYTRNWAWRDHCSNERSARSLLFLFARLAAAAAGVVLPTWRCLSFEKFLSAAARAASTAAAVLLSLTLRCMSLAFDWTSSRGKGSLSCP